MTMFDGVLQSEVVIKASQYYQGLSARDRLALNALAVFAAVILFIYVLILPAWQYQQAALASYQEEQETLAWMQANRHLVGGAVSADRAGRSLLGVVNSTAKNFQLAFNRYEPVGEDGLNLWMDAVVFDRLVAWLGMLQQEHGVSVQEIAVERGAGEGRVNVRLVLRG